MVEIGYPGYVSAGIQEDLADLKNTILESTESIFLAYEDHSI